MLPIRVRRQLFDALVGHGDGRHGPLCRAGLPPVLSLILVAGFALIIPLAYASPPDPNWITGIYDAADGDDVVGFLTDTNAAGYSSSPPAVRLLSAPIARLAAPSPSPASSAWRWPGGSSSCMGAGSG
jgi:hypothetical protein